MCCQKKHADKEAERPIASPSSSSSSSKAQIPHINLQSVLDNDLSGLAATTSGPQTVPPGYEEAMNESSLTKDDSNHSEDSQDEALPSYADVPKDKSQSPSSSQFLTSTAPGFSPTVSFQIEARGHPLVALPFAPKPAHVPVYRVGSGGEASQELAYMSLRDLKGKGGSCLLVDGETKKVGSVTSYRFGPGKPAKLRYIKDGPAVLVNDDDLIAMLLKEEEGRFGDGKGKAKEKQQPAETEQSEEKIQLPHSEVIEITSNGFSTRSHTLLTPLGTFRWRYATKSERLEANADDLLIMERIYTVSVPSASKFRKDKTEKRRKRVAMLVRNEELRAEGTGPREAGNGGRLICDFGEWEGRAADGGGNDEHEGQGVILEEKRRSEGFVSEERREVEVLTVAGCLSMLKKEIDRRRVHQTMVIIGSGAVL